MARCDRYARARRACMSLAVLVAVAVLGCTNAEVDDSGRRPVRSQTSASTTKDVKLDLVYPAGSGITKVVAGVGNAITLGSGVRVLDVDGSPGGIANSSTQVNIGLTLGANSQVGNLASGSSINIGAGATAGQVRSGGTVTRGANTHVASVLEHATLTPVVVRTITVHAPTGPHTSLTIPASATASLAPAEYANVTVGANAALTLSAGTYFSIALR